MRSEALDEEVLIQLKRSGCTGIVYAPESGSPTTLREIKKRVKPEKMLESLRAAVKHGHQTRAHIIFGFPNQDLKQVLDGVEGRRPGSDRGSMNLSPRSIRFANSDAQGFSVKNASGPHSSH